MKQLLLALLMFGSFSVSATNTLFKNTGFINCNFKDNLQVTVIADKDRNGVAFVMKKNVLLEKFSIRSGGNGDTYAVAVGKKFEFSVDAESSFEGYIKLTFSNGKELEENTEEYGCSRISKEWPHGNLNY